MGEKEMKEEIVKAVRRHLRLPHYRVILFGSRATGRAREGSDFDIGVDGRGDVPFQTLALVEGDLEDLPTLLRVDVVDLAKTDVDFAERVKSKGQVLYEQ
jgi:predicted nucleotidyltransferase